MPFEELCDEDKIMAFFGRLMSEWSQEVDEVPEADGQGEGRRGHLQARHLVFFLQLKKLSQTVLNKNRM